MRFPFKLLCSSAALINLVESSQRVCDASLVKNLFLASPDGVSLAIDQMITEALFLSLVDDFC